MNTNSTASTWPHQGKVSEEDKAWSYIAYTLEVCIYMYLYDDKCT